MAEQRESEAQNPPATIWSQLDGWARGFRAWQRFVIANAVRNGWLTDEQIERAYQVFLENYGLAEASDPPIEVPAAISGRPAEAAPVPIWLRRIGDLRGINALPAGGELTFSPTLTVVYGGNGVGKTGYTRILSNVCFSRTQHPILPNVYEEDAPGKPAAKIVMADGTQQETVFEFDGSTEHSELRRIAVFDTGCGAHAFGGAESSRFQAGRVRRVSRDGPGLHRARQPPWCGDSATGPGQRPDKPLCGTGELRFQVRGRAGCQHRSRGASPVGCVRRNRGGEAGGGPAANQGTAFQIGRGGGEAAAGCQAGYRRAAKAPAREQQPSDRRQARDLSDRARSVP